MKPDKGQLCGKGGNKKGKKTEFRAELLWTLFLIQINRKSIRIKCSGAPITEFDTHCKHKGLPHIKIAEILLLFIIFMQVIYSHVPETNHVSSVYNVAAIL
jgi:hypothetical protein